jgi:hypothetical protein
LATSGIAEIDKAVAMKKAEKKPACRVDEVGVGQVQTENESDGKGHRNPDQTGKRHHPAFLNQSRKIDFCSGYQQQEYTANQARLPRSCVCGP